VNDEVEIMSITFRRFQRVGRSLVDDDFRPIKSDEKPPNVDRLLVATPFYRGNACSQKQTFNIVKCDIWSGTNYSVLN
jgi:hypothetical protein